MTRSSFVMTISMGAISLVATSSSFAQECVGFDKRFLGVNGNGWHEPSNWEPPVAPTGLQTACIPSDRTAVVEAGATPNAFAKTIRIEGESGNPATGGNVVVESGATITLHGDSVINGSMKLKGDATLFINPTLSSMTITGDGGEIKGDTEGGPTFTPAIIDNVGTQNKGLIITGATSERTRSLVVRGGLDIRVNLNNKAYVVADKKNNPLLLSVVAKKVGIGGFWIAERDPDHAGGYGTLKVNASVKGGGQWTLVDHHICTIEFNAPCQSLTGDFFIEKGSVDVNDNLITTGNLHWHAIPPDNEEIVSQMIIAEGKTATFSP